MLFPSLRSYGATLAIAGFATFSSAATDFKTQVMPILQKKCADCHSEAKKVKGKFDINKEENYAENVKAGTPDASKLYTSVIAPDDDDESMPPKGKNRLTKPEVAIIKAWITEGASFAAGGGKAVAPVTAAPAAGGAAQSWTNTAGKVLTASFDRLEGEAVVLKAADGKYYTVPLANLSPESQAQAKKAAGQ